MPIKDLENQLNRMNPSASHANLGTLLEEMIAKVNVIIDSYNIHLAESGSVHGATCTATSVATMTTIAEREIYP
jgi:hypothetical protein